MKRFPLVLLALAAAWVGCETAPAPGPQSSQSTREIEMENVAVSTPIESPAGPMTLVSLKVPNMV